MRGLLWPLKPHGLSRKRQSRVGFLGDRESQYNNSGINSAGEGEAMASHCWEEVQWKPCCCCRKYQRPWSHVAIHPDLPTALLPGSPCRIECNLRDHLHQFVQWLHYVIRNHQEPPLPFHKLHLPGPGKRQDFVLACRKKCTGLRVQTWHLTL